MNRFICDKFTNADTVLEKKKGTKVVILLILLKF
jgi:hypothetical protein